MTNPSRPTDPPAPAGAPGQAESGCRLTPPGRTLTAQELKGLTAINLEDPNVRQWARHLGQAGGVDALAALNDPAHPHHKAVLAWACACRGRELTEFAERYGVPLPRSLHVRPDPPARTRQESAS